ncbi:MAG: GTPase domain-containing protein [Sedimentitalea sp.]
MKDNLCTPSLLGPLQGLVRAGALPARVQERAARLLDRLDRPILVAVLGPDGVGKSQLLDVLLGQNIPRPGGTSVLLAPPGCGDRFDLNACVVEIESEDLTHMAFLDVTGSGLDQALAKADIVLWCTHVFGSDEARIWAPVSDDLKDHSFLVLTRFADHGAARLPSVQAVALEEFHSLFPVETAQTHSSLCNNQPVIGTLDQRSGVAALRQAIIRLVEDGRRALEDAAQAVLDRYDTGADLRTPVPVTVPDPMVAIDATEPEPRDAVLAPVVTAEDQFYMNAQQLLERRLEDLSHNLASAPEPQDRLVLDHCLETCDALASAVMGVTASETHQIQFHDDVLSAADTVLLMAMEDGSGPAADAATIVLQLRRDLHARLAA